MYRISSLSSFRTPDVDSIIIYAHRYIAVSVFHAAVSVADFHNTIASVVLPEDRSWYNFENHRSTPGPNEGLRKTPPMLHKPVILSCVVPHCRGSATS